MSFAAFACWLLLAACQGESEKAEDRLPEPLTYLALGDSYTIGEAVEEAGRYPVQLADSLEARGLPVSRTQIVAVTGWRTDELSDSLDVAPLDSAYGMVSLLIGVNDQYQGRSVESFRPEFDALLARAVDLAGGREDRVFVVSIPDYGVTPFAEGRPGADTVGQAIDAYNAAKRAACEREGVAFYDVTPISREAAADSTLVASDGLHPSAEMYRRWVALLAPDWSRRISRPER